MYTNNRNYTPKELKEIIRIKKETNECFYCHKPFTNDNQKTIDHIYAWCKTKNNSKSNLVCCCKTCNTEKDNLSTEEFIKIKEQTDEEIKTNSIYMLLNSTKNNYLQLTEMVDKLNTDIQNIEQEIKMDLKVIERTEKVSASQGWLLYKELKTHLDEKETLKEQKKALTKVLNGNEKNVDNVNKQIDSLHINIFNKIRRKTIDKLN